MATVRGGEGRRGGGREGEERRGEGGEGEMAYTCMLLHCELASFSGYSPGTISGNNANP